MIQLVEPIDIPDGRVYLEIDAARLSYRGSILERLNHLFGIWQNEPEIDLIFTELDRQRHNDYGRNIDSFD
jgi:hypothetical protein